MTQPDLMARGIGSHVGKSASIIPCWLTIKSAVNEKMVRS